MISAVNFILCLTTLWTYVYSVKVIIKTHARKKPEWAFESFFKNRLKLLGTENN